MGDGEIAIRPAVEADETAIRDIVAAAYTPYVARIGREPGPMGDDYRARIAAGQAWIAAYDGQIAGLLVIDTTQARFLLDNIAVAPAFQGRGVGRALLEFVEHRARAGRFDEIVLYTHVLMTENIALYRRIGFVETGRVREHGFERVYMAKALA